MVRYPFMTGPCYSVVADAVMAITDLELRQKVADHLATYFHKRSPSFDPYHWERKTGGKVERPTK